MNLRAEMQQEFSQKTTQILDLEKESEDVRGETDSFYRQLFRAINYLVKSEYLYFEEEIEELEKMYLFKFERDRSCETSPRPA
ncbi:15585_t:CDS:2, partial [Funneliformis geosporum]